MDKVEFLRVLGVIVVEVPGLMCRSVYVKNVKVLLVRSDVLDTELGDVTDRALYELDPAL